MSLGRKSLSPVIGITRFYTTDCDASHSESPGLLRQVVTRVTRDSLVRQFRHSRPSAGMRQSKIDHFLLSCGDLARALNSVTPITNPGDAAHGVFRAPLSS